MRRLLQAHAFLTELASGVPPAGMVRLSFDARWAHLVVDHPEARGAISVSMMVALAEAVLSLRGWPGALLVVSSSDPRSFCSGGDLRQLPALLSSPEQAAAMSHAMTTVLDALGALPQLSVSALDGPAVGGGAELALATDFRVAGPNGALHFAHARLGIVTGWGGAGRIVAVLGRTRALSVLARALPVSSEAAVDLGLVDLVCDGDVVAAAKDWLEGGEPFDALALRAAKAQVVAAGNHDQAAAIAAFASVWGGPAHQAALALRSRERSR